MVVAALAACATKPPANGYAAASPAPDPTYVFAWPFLETHKGMSPRGGTTRGTEVTLIKSPSSAWTRLQAPGLAAFERDRAAILAMAGDYRASFDFLETAVYPSPDALAADARIKPSRPYRSWGTERVYVASDSGAFISLQHVMVMFYEDDKGAKQGPMVIKHWRQDWRFEPAHISAFRGHRIWERLTLDPAERKGAWSQSVYHVDDSPRYASAGRWEHNASFSTWAGQATRRPLPRREHSVRSDYHALEGRNRHTILPGGWLHEQDNLKLVLDSAGKLDATAPYRSREIGVDRYDLIQGFDFSAGDDYWKGTGPFWARVRARWASLLDAPSRLRADETCKGEPAFAAFFSLADSTAGPTPPAPASEAAALDGLFGCIVSDVTHK